MSEPPTEDDAPAIVSRRHFLKSSAAAAGATLLASCGGGGGEEPILEGATEVDPLTRFDHLVVVMFENRSFDNLLGYLYSDGPTPADWPAAVPVPPPVPAGASFNGLFGKTHYSDDGSARIYAHPHDFAPTSTLTTDWTHPDPDPDEGFAPTAEQIDGGTMRGFVRNYRKRHASATEAQVDAIMGSYAPAHLPVLSTLAREFAVFDHWFCAVPSETYCNRSFFHASTSSGFVQNQPVDKWQGNTADTILDRLEAASPRIAWKVYFESPASESERAALPHGLTGLIHPRTSGRYPERFVDYSKFFTDVAQGTLPAYSFFERLYGGHDDFHPPGDVRAGEEVLRQVYEAIRTSAYAINTLLLVVFDEHGGTYDHVAPKASGVPAPEAPPVPHEQGYDFTSLGLRVPAIAISAHTPAGTVINTPMHHAAVIRTLRRKYGLAPLTLRDQDPEGGDLGVAVSAVAPRNPATWPAFPAPSHVAPV
jgi:phospholipase C